MARKGDGMVAHINTVAFQGIEARDIDVQVSFSSGLPSFTIVGLPDKAVAESRERVRSAIGAMGLSLPPKRITVNLAPADILKEGSHFDLPIALGLLVAMDVIGVEDLSEYAALGELGLDGALIPVAGVLLAAVEANANGLGLICPEQNGAGAVWAGGEDVLGASSLLALVNHFKGSQIISPPAPAVPVQNHVYPDLRDIKGQEVAKRSLEVAAAGAHNLLLIGPPGSGKSMLAQRLPGILPPLEVREALTISMIASVVGLLRDGVVTLARPFRDPHHSASMPALVGGDVRAKPGEVSLAHQGVLFLDELPEFSCPVLDALRQPTEIGKISIARANAHVSYPARFQLIAAMIPAVAAI
jgi:magnesium chelatase family protein